MTTRRWNDPPQEGEGTRILITRYRPRGVLRTEEPWDEWHPALGPSVELHSDAYGKRGPAITFDEYETRYRQEMTSTRSAFLLRALRSRIAGGEDVVLLCSSACEDERCCHRTLLRALVS